MSHYTFKEKKEHYDDLLDRVKSKLQAWKGKLLSYGGKEVLLKNVLQSIPIYVLLAIVPSKSVFKELQRMAFQRDRKE